MASFLSRAFGLLFFFGTFVLGFALIFAGGDATKGIPFGVLCVMLLVVAVVMAVVGSMVGWGLGQAVFPVRCLACGGRMTPYSKVVGNTAAEGHVCERCDPKPARKLAPPPLPAGRSRPAPKPACPKCGFGYSWDGAVCSHCGHGKRA